MSAPPVDPTNRSILREGDTAAGAGNWTRAIALWTAARRGPHRLDAERRLSWFLEEGTPYGVDGGKRLARREVGNVILLAGCGLAILGTAAVLFGIGRDGLVQDVVSVVAWVCYIAAAALALAWARHAGRNPATSPALLDDDAYRALDLAVSLDAAAAGARHDRS